MTLLEGTRAARFELVTAAHHLVLAALPLRHPESRQALSTFVALAGGCRLSSPDRESVLIKLLGVLDPHTGGRLPSLVDRYLILAHDIPDGPRRFQRCVEDVFRYRGIGNVYVEQAIALLCEHYTEAACEKTVAELLGLTPSALCTAFRSQTGMTFTEYLRGVRLDHAAAMLAQSTKNVKEVWAAVGYNDAANFNHDFRDRFGMTPSEYQARGIRPAPMMTAAGSSSMAGAPNARPEGEHRRVLVVDDHAGTRETLAVRLRLAGYETDTAASGHEAIERASSVTPDVIVLDFHLPDMDGLECLRALRSRRPGVHPPVILFTADWEVEDRAGEAHALGAAIVSKLSDMADVERRCAHGSGLTEQQAAGSRQQKISRSRRSRR